MKKVRLGIVGMGIIGCHYASLLLRGEVQNMRLAAVTRIGRHQGEWAARELPEDFPVFQTAEELFDSGLIDAVLIATPHYEHEKYTVLALQRGLHVLCEKPSGAYTLQAERMNREAEKSGLIFAMMFHQRTFPVYRRLKELIDSGMYGELRRIHWVITDWYREDSYYQSNAWRAAYATDGGGVLLNQSIHNLDMLQWLCGMPCRVQAFCQEGRWHQIEVEDEATAYLEFENGATGTFITSTGDYPGVNRLQIDLGTAQILCENGRLTIQSSEDKKTKSVQKIIPAPWEQAYQTMLANFAEAILTGEKLIADGREGLNSLMLCNAMYLSSWKKQMIELPLDGEAYRQELAMRSGK